MKGDRPFALTEWDWFQLSLEIHSLKRQHPAMRLRFEYREDRTIQCTIYSTSTRNLVDAKSSRSEQLRFYMNWVSNEKAKIASIFRPLPGLSHEFDPEHDIVFDIVYDDGKSAVPVCTIRGNHVKWY